jgi:hypothetical protein
MLEASSAAEEVRGGRRSVKRSAKRRRRLGSKRRQEGEKAEDGGASESAHVRRLLRSSRASTHPCLRSPLQIWMVGMRKQRAAAEAQAVISMALVRAIRPFPSLVLAAVYSAIVSARSAEEERIAVGAVPRLARL